MDSKNGIEKTNDLAGTDLLKKWDDLVPAPGDSRETIKAIFQERDAVIQQMNALGMYPEKIESALEKHSGLYPAIDDPQFIQKLMAKREFAESKQVSIEKQEASGIDLCNIGNQEFELTPVQRFVSRLLNPSTPYHSALLYHGVGVGKTCAAITIAEAYLEQYPREQVIIVAPPNIQPEFERNIFRAENLVLGKGFEEGVTPIANTANGCTGNTYLKLTGTLFEQDRKYIETEIKRLIKKRYSLMGYQKFAETIERITAKKASADETNRQINERFGGKVIIIDEAHNLRDNPDEKEEDSLDAPGGRIEVSDSQAGKRLTPFLKRLLMSAEGITLVLLTGTPMYNEYTEIIFLLNLLLLNEKKPISQLLVRDKIFNADGTFKVGGREKIGEVANRYVSFMRGENPLSFPIRLPPEPKITEGVPDIELLTDWPILGPNGVKIPEVELTKTKQFNLPIVKCYFKGDTEEEFKKFTIQSSTASMGLDTTNALIQAGNWIYPLEEGSTIQERTRNSGFDACFSSRTEGKLVVFTARNSSSSGASWLREDEIGAYSPKTEILLKRIRTSKGCVFIYSRFVKVGGLSIALALEANGYTPHNRERGFLTNGIQSEGGRQCARCQYKEKAHRTAPGNKRIEHEFVPAKYVFLSGEDSYSPNNKEAVEAEQRPSNLNGEGIKVVIGSQVSGEGINLKYIREIYVFDSWFHLNKLEQIIGRGIRYCSHSLLKNEKEDKRNCTIYLLVNAFRDNERETMDMYSYRRAIRKASEVGRVSRTLKEFAIDCNLNHDAILIANLTPVKMTDSQGVVREKVNRNDVSFTALCDWESCETYECKPKVDIDLSKMDEKTYTEYAARWREKKLIDRVKQLFTGKSGEANQAFVTIEDFIGYFSDISRKSLSILIQTILKSKSFRIELFGKQGRIIYKNGYFLFQPFLIQDETIPLALRIAAYPVKKDSYIPTSSTVIETTQKRVEQMKRAAKPLEEAPTIKEEPKEEFEAEKSFWNSIVEWSDAIRTKNPLANDIPASVRKELAIYHKREDKLISRSIQRFEQIVWFYTSVKENEEWRKVLADILEEIVWDEFILVTEQLRFYRAWKNDNRYKHILQEHIVKKDTETAFRFIDYRTGAIRYMCENGTEECSEAVVPIFEESAENTLRGLKADPSNTGFLYGFLVPKKGDIVFKNGKPTPPGQKMEKGQECSISSAVGDHMKKLISLGEEIKKTKGTDFDLSIDKFTGARKFENAVRACFLMDIVMRCMDRIKISNKRWFYKSLAAAYTGHKGTYEKV